MSQTILTDAYFAKLKALAMGIEKFRECDEEDKENQFKIVGRLLARYESQIVADLIDRQILDEVEKYGAEAFEQANGYAYQSAKEIASSRPTSSGESEEVRERPSKPRRAKRNKGLR